METSHHSDCDMQRKLKELVYLTLSPHSITLLYTAGKEAFYSLILSQRGLLRRHHFPKAIIILLLQQIMMKENKKERKTERHFNKEKEMEAYNGKQSNLEKQPQR